MTIFYKKTPLITTALVFGLTALLSFSKAANAAAPTFYAFKREASDMHRLKPFTGIKQVPNMFNELGNTYRIKRTLNDTVVAATFNENGNMHNITYSKNKFNGKETHCFYTQSRNSFIETPYVGLDECVHVKDNTVYRALAYYQGSFIVLRYNRITKQNLWSVHKSWSDVYEDKSVNNIKSVGSVKVNGYRGIVAKKVNETSGLVYTFFNNPATKDEWVIESYSSMTDLIKRTNRKSFVKFKSPENNTTIFFGRYISQ